MSLGKIIQFKDGSYDIRAIVDGHHVVRIRYHATNSEKYRVWTQEERERFDRYQGRMLENEDRNCQIYERYLAGETYISLGWEYSISSSRVRDICAKRARKEKLAKS